MCWTTGADLLGATLGRMQSRPAQDLCGGGFIARAGSNSKERRETKSRRTEDAVEATIEGAEDLEAVRAGRRLVQHSRSPGAYRRQAVTLHPPLVGDR